MQLGETHRGACGPRQLTAVPKALERGLPVATRVLKAVVHVVDGAAQEGGRRVAVRVDEGAQRRGGGVDVTGA